MRTKARCQGHLQKLQIKTRKKLFTHPSFLIAPLKNILAIKNPLLKKEKKNAVYEIKLNWSFHNADLVGGGKKDIGEKRNPPFPLICVLSWPSICAVSAVEEY